MAQITDFFIDQGSDWSAILTFNNTDGTARDFTNCTVSGQMRKGYNSTTYTALTTIFPAPATQGKVKISLGHATSSALKAGRYVYDIELIDSFNARSRLVEGIITLTPEVTR
jgi:hypothetical protein